MCKKLIFVVSIVLLLCVSVNSANADITTDLISHWKLDDGSGTTARDNAGVNNGTLKGDATWAEGWTGGAVLLDGDDDYVDCGQGTAFNTVCRNVITLAAWIKADTEGWTTWGGIIFRGQAEQFGNNPPNDTFAYYFNGATEQLGFKITDVSAQWSTVAASEVLDGEWHHTAATYDGAEKAIYLDAVEIARVECTGGIPEGEGTGRIIIGGGRDVDPMLLEFRGLIDDARIYDRALIQEEIVAVMENVGSYPFASGPNPPVGAIHPDTWVNLSWRAGDFAVSHDIYFGDNFDEVNEGAEGKFVGNQADTFIIVGFPGFPFPDGLVPGTTYYWRIDEVNEAEPNSPWKGDIWSFMIAPKTAYLSDPADDAEGVSVDVTLGWTPGFGAKFHTVYFGETFEEVDTAVGGQSQATLTYSPGTLKMAKTYYWRVDEFDVAETHKGDVWSFTTEGGVVVIDPANDAVDVSQTPVLTWTPGLGATHEVYFGTDADALEQKGSGNLGSESFEPGQLEWNTTYYWRVDEANSANADSPWTGPLWSLTTANFLIIDDMEAYNDLDPADPNSNRIFNAWIDGFEDPANGSLVGYDNAPFAEQTIVHTGLQSLPLYYDNSAAGKSEATLTLTSNRDWTVKDVDTLTIWFRGSAANAGEQMYVTLNDTARVDNDNPDAVKVNKWTPWNIELQKFADQGVNLTNVNSITLGLSSVTGGTGTMYFDDIHLYAP